MTRRCGTCQLYDAPVELCRYRCCENGHGAQDSGTLQAGGGVSDAK